MSAHTPGPWTAVEQSHTAGPCPEDPELRYFHIYGPEGRLDEKLQIRGYMRPADAALIAYAPRMLQLLQESMAEIAAITELVKEAQS